MTSLLSSLLAVALLKSLMAIAAAENVDYTYGSTRIRFLGKSPNFQIYPNTSLDTYLQLRFSKIEERTTADQKVQGHSVESLASADPIWESGNMTLSDGTNLTYVSMTLDPTTRNGFDIACPANGARRLLADSRKLTAAPSTTTTTITANSTWIRVTLFFGLDQNASFPYGYNKTVNVSQGGLKFSVEYNKWPFCNDNNTLSMQIQLSLKGNTTGSPTVSDGSNGAKVLTLPLGDNYNSTINFANYAYEGKNGNRSLPVAVSLDTSGGNTVIALRLPNPKPNATVYYDPTVTVSSSPGAASGVRMTLWSVLPALLLSIFLRA